jgi:RNA polymerase sigma-70 factor (ECF subfamily)
LSLDRPGDRQASFSAWYGEEAAGVTRTLAVALGNVELAQEAVAEAFARAWARWDRVAAMASPTGWVYTVALNVARTDFSRAGRAGVAARFTPGATELTESPPLRDDELWGAVRALPPRARLAIALRYVADLTEAEVALVMGVSRGTVASTLSEARRRLDGALSTNEECST